jgi:hypothetical protein
MGVRLGPLAGRSLERGYEGVSLPVGTCIYCGQVTDSEKLSDEHVVPYALDGTIVLPEASCDSCARIINSQIETPILRKTLWQTRVNLGMQSRSDPPTEFVVEVRCADGSVRRAKVPAADAPVVCYGFQLPLAGLLEGRTTSRPWGVLPLIVRIPNLERTIIAVKSVAGESINTLNVSLEEHCRFLAKIAHGFAVAMLGIDGFEHLLPSIILNQDVPNKPPRADYPQLIGLDPTPKSTAPKSGPCEVQANTCVVNGVSYATVGIDFFPYLDLPRYVVVVGKLLRPPRPPARSLAAGE